MGFLRRFHFLVFALVCSLLYMGVPFGFGGQAVDSVENPQPQTGRYIYSSEVNESSSGIANHCVGLSFQNCCQYERDNKPAVFIAIYLSALLYVFLAVAIVCDDYFVPSLELLSERLDLSEDVAGATFMAAGSSAPELFTSLASVTAESDVGVGTIVGSAVFNILVIIALTAALTKKDLHLDWRPLVRDSFFYGCSIIIFIVCVLDGEVQWYESVVLLTMYGLYCLIMKYNEKLLNFMAGFSKSKVNPSDEPGVVEAQKGNSEMSPNPAASNNIDLPAVRQGFADDEFKSDGSNSPIMTPRSHRSRTVVTSAKKQHDGEEKTHFKHHNRADEKIRTSLIRRASMTADLTMNEHIKGFNVKTDTNLSDFIEEADDFEVKQIAFDTEKRDHHPILWYLFSGIYMIDKPEKSTDKKGVISLIIYCYEWFVYILAVPLYFLMSLSIPECARLDMRKYYVLSFIMSIVWIAGLTIIMVVLVEKMGCILHMSLFIMGLFLVAAGTSIPDAMSSILVARDGFADMAVSNAIGSNIFDINLGLGLPFFVKAMWQYAVDKPATVNLLSPAERARYEASKVTGVYYMVPHVQFGIILFFILMVTLSVFVATRFRLNRPLGLALFAVYIAFVIYGMIKEFVCNEDKGIRC